MGAAGVQRIEGLIQRLNDPAITYLDISQVMLRPEDRRPDPTIFLEDSLHMNDLGYDRWEPLVYNELKKILNFKDSEDLAMAHATLDRIFTDRAFSDHLSAALQEIVLEFAGNLPQIDSAYWRNFTRRKISPNLNTIDQHIRQSLIDSLSMAEWAELELELYQKASYPSGAILERFEELLEQALIPIRYGLSRAIVADLEQRKLIASDADPAACREFHEGDFYVVSTTGSDTLRIERSGNQQQELGIIHPTVYSVKWLDDCSFELAKTDQEEDDEEKAVAETLVEILQTNEQAYLCKTTHRDAFGEQVQLQWMRRI